MPDLPQELTIDDALITRIIDGMAINSPTITQKQWEEGPGLLPTGSKDLETFFEETQVILNDYQERLGINEQDRIRLVEDFTPEDFTTQLIAFKMIQSLPGKVSQGRIGPSMQAGERHEWVPRCRYVIDDGEMPNSRTFVMGQYFDNMIEFTCWARTNKAANKTTRLFQDLMNIYRFYFKLKGFPEVLFRERREDIVLDSQIRDGLKGRPMRYTVRTDRTYKVYEPVLRDIVLNLVLSNS
jgi:hypothetical protein